MYSHFNNIAEAKGKSDAYDIPLIVAIHTDDPTQNNNNNNTPLHELILGGLLQYVTASAIGEKITDHKKKPVHTFEEVYANKTSFTVNPQFDLSQLQNNNNNHNTMQASLQLLFSLLPLYPLTAVHYLSSRDEAHYSLFLQTIPAHYNTDEIKGSFPRFYIYPSSKRNTPPFVLYNHNKSTLTPQVLYQTIFQGLKLPQLVQSNSFGMTPNQNNNNNALSADLKKFKESLSKTISEMNHTSIQSNNTNNNNNNKAPATTTSTTTTTDTTTANNNNEYIKVMDIPQKAPKDKKVFKIYPKMTLKHIWDDLQRISQFIVKDAERVMREGGVDRELLSYKKRAANPFLMRILSGNHHEIWKEVKSLAEAEQVPLSSLPQDSVIQLVYAGDEENTNTSNNHNNEKKETEKTTDREANKRVEAGNPSPNNNNNNNNNNTQTKVVCDGDVCRRVPVQPEKKPEEEEKKVTPAPAPATQNNNNNNTTITLRYTLPSGEHGVVAQLADAVTLATSVRPVVEGKLGHPHFELREVGVVPARKFTSEEETEKTLKELNIKDRTTLRVVPTEEAPKPAVAEAPKDDNNNPAIHVNPNSSMMSMGALFGAMKNFFPGNNKNNNDPNHPAEEPDPEQMKEMMNMLQKRMKYENNEEESSPEQEEPQGMRPFTGTGRRLQEDPNTDETKEEGEEKKNQ